MTPFEQQMAVLRERWPSARCQDIAGGAKLIEIFDYQMPSGWNLERVTLLFVAPVGFPAAQPDCFWLESVGTRVPVRLKDGRTPQASNDSNPIPGVGPRGTWFSWHLQRWNPNVDTLMTYCGVIAQRLKPPR